MIKTLAAVLALTVSVAWAGSAHAASLDSNKQLHMSLLERHGALKPRLTNPEQKKRLEEAEGRLKKIEEELKNPKLTPADHDRLEKSLAAEEKVISELEKSAPAHPKHVANIALHKRLMARHAALRTKLTKPEHVKALDAAEARLNKIEEELKSDKLTPADHDRLEKSLAAEEKVISELEKSAPAHPKHVANIALHKRLMARHAALRTKLTKPEHVKALDAAEARLNKIEEELKSDKLTPADHDRLEKSLAAEEKVISELEKSAPTHPKHIANIALHKRLMARHAALRTKLTKPEHVKALDAAEARLNKIEEELKSDKLTEADHNRLETQLKDEEKTIAELEKKP